MNQDLKRILIQLVVFIIKTGQVNNAIKIALWAYQQKASYDETMARLYDPEYFNKKIEKAADKYRKENYKETVINITGYENYLKAIGGDKK